MTRFRWTVFLTAGACGLLGLAAVSPACCPVGPQGKPVVNADQTMIILWDAATKTQHLIRKASFKSAADDFGFLVPTPTKPDLSESGNEAFPFLQKLTEPEIKKVPRPSGGVSCGCGAVAPKSASRDLSNDVRVLEEKLVAGFHAAVLEADSAGELVKWLDGRGYAFSPEVEEWVRPYVEQGWKITALKIAKSDGENVDPNVTASALHMSFQTDTPLFPYREPDFKQQTSAVGASHRLLRIFFIGDARYRGELTKDHNWSGRPAWSDSLSAENRTKILDLLGLSDADGPRKFWLTEFEDNWAYVVAPSDLRFARDGNQKVIHREPIILYVSTNSGPDVTPYLFAVVFVVPGVVRTFRQRRKSTNE
ncbi:MAG: DUF2330 domain-containing protein [Planctomycetia bacterium]|nr:DUF2330 domain-containing protein [Planctomycetia bacterium]